ncbi:hypothetical protein JXR01_03750 [Candidatus Kaiserbacteria bacterium]|nr:MAG: hypothetical protein JXR01_03750 [Candidatus Kaiserbacteria bacterium]
MLHPLVLVVSGALVGLTTVLPYTFLLLVALIPFVYLVSTERPYREIIRGSFLFGVGFFSIAYLWVWGVYPLEWIGVADWRISFALVLFFWVFTASSLSLTMVARAVVTRALVVQYTKGTALIVSVVWVIFEYLAALSVSLVWAGGQGVIGAHWAFGFLGYALAEIPVLRSLSAIGGVYALSFTAVFSVAALYCFFLTHRDPKKYDFKNSLIVAGLLVLGALLWYGLSHFDSLDEQKTAALIHTAYSSKLQRLTNEESKKRALDTFEQLERKVDEDAHIDIVLFPEGSAVLNKIPQERIEVLFKKLAPNSNTLFLNPANNNNVDKDLISSVWYVRVQTGIVEIRNKEFLVPVGEYKPYFANVLSIFPSIDNWLESTYEYHGYTKVPEREVVFKEDEVGVLQCSEILSPVFYRELAEEHKVLANAASHAPFTRPFLVRHQTLKMARIHAVSNDRFFIQSGNVAPSYVVTNRGAIQSFLNTHNTGVLVDSVSLRNTVTPYTRWGDWFVGFLILFLLPFLWKVVMRKGREGA